MINYHNYNDKDLSLFEIFFYVGNHHNNFFHHIIQTFWKKRKYLWINQMASCHAIHTLKNIQNSDVISELWSGEHLSCLTLFRLERKTFFHFFLRSLFPERSCPMCIIPLMHHIRLHSCLRCWKQTIINGLSFEFCNCKSNLIWSKHSMLI